jgi:hypothetical protein
VTARDVAALLGFAFVAGWIAVKLRVQPRDDRQAIGRRDLDLGNDVHARGARASSVSESHPSL